MKKVTGIVMAMLMMGVLLSGCYSTSCPSQDQPVMKDSSKAK